MTPIPIRNLLQSSIEWIRLIWIDDVDDACAAPDGVPVQHEKDVK